MSRLNAAPHQPKKVFNDYKDGFRTAARQNPRHILDVADKLHLDFLQAAALREAMRTGVAPGAN
jgi:hypothetical protein